MVDIAGIFNLSSRQNKQKSKRVFVHFADFFPKTWGTDRLQPHMAFIYLSGRGGSRHSEFPTGTSIWNFFLGKAPGRPAAGFPICPLDFSKNF
jgi:hypothetical protein